MKIDPSLTKVGSSGGTERVVGQTAQEVRTSRNIAAAEYRRVCDEAVFSDWAREVMLARRALANVPEVRADKVQELKRQIAEGSFRVDPEVVVDKLLRGGTP